MALSPAACKRAITSDHDDPSANSPCTRTTMRAFGAGCAAAALPRKSACRPCSHAHEGASIHWIPRPKIVLASHGSSPFRKIGVGYWESLSWLLGTFEFARLDCRPPLASSLSGCPEFGAEICSAAKNASTSAERMTVPSFTKASARLRQGVLAAPLVRDLRRVMSQRLARGAARFDHGFLHVA